VRVKALSGIVAPHALMGQLYATQCAWLSRSAAVVAPDAKQRC